VTIDIRHSPAKKGRPGGTFSLMLIKNCADAQKVEPIGLDSVGFRARINFQ
jgi:hypothetical protein